ncbi:hypothetical protein B0H14DRAFT_2614207 [Mycena olivaceomarginata]|nr:hypothetical protein B0H14DRAFT_2614207 [Mycena olivaceomarginata]
MSDGECPEETPDDCRGICKLIYALDGEAPRQFELVHPTQAVSVVASADRRLGASLDVPMGFTLLCVATVLPIVTALNLVSNDRFRRDIMLGAGTWKRVPRRNDTSVLANAFVVAPEFLVEMELLNQHVVEEEKRQSGCARAAAAAIIDRALFTHNIHTVGGCSFTFEALKVEKHFSFSGFQTSGSKSSTALRRYQNLKKAEIILLVFVVALFHLPSQ